MNELIVIWFVFSNCQNLRRFVLICTYVFFVSSIHFFYLFIFTSITCGVIGH